MKLRHIAAVLALVAGVVWNAPVHAQTLGAYDTFSSGELDPGRWRGYEGVIPSTESRDANYNGGYHDNPTWDESPYGPSSVGEIRRRVVNGQAQVALTTAKRGGRQGGGYSHGMARAGVRMNHPGLAAPSDPLVTTLRASVTVAGVSAEPPDPATETCSLNNSARAQVFGHFFNDGSSAGPGDLTGDFFASVSLARRVQYTSAGYVVGNFVEARIGRCNTPGCRIHWKAVRFTRTWTVGAAHVVTIAWQPASNRFVFTVSGGGVPTESRAVAYSAAADSAPPRGYAYDLRVESQPGLCGDTVRQELIWQTVSMDARFDNVQLNSAAATAAR
jgi:hypothetical protein